MVTDLGVAPSTRDQRVASCCSMRRVVPLPVGPPLYSDASTTRETSVVAAEKHSEPRNTGGVLLSPRHRWPTR